MTDSTLSPSADDLLLLTIEEAGRRLRLGRTSMYQLISSGAIESVTVGRLRRIPAESLQEYVSSLRAANHDARS